MVDGGGVHIYVYVCVCVLTHTHIPIHQAAELEAQLGAARAKVQALEDRLATPTPPKPTGGHKQAKTPRTPQQVG